MGRLIDADAFERSVMCSDAEDMQDVIYALRDYPTAYDPDKVVEQLEELKSLVPVNRLLDDIVNEKPKELGMLIAYEKAIEIVEGGGVDAD